MNSLTLKVDLDFDQLLKVVKQLSPSEKLKLNDLREIVIWYNNTSNDLGIQFHKQVKS